MASPSEQLQKVVYDALVSDPDLYLIVAGRVFDRVPETVNYPFVTIGASDVRPDDHEGVSIRSESMDLHSWARDGGTRRSVRVMNDAIYDALHEVELSLSVDELTDIRVVSTRAMLDPDGETSHGVVTITALIERA